MSTQAGYSTNAPTPLVTTAETVVGTFTVPPLANPGGQGLMLSCFVILTTGAAATSITTRIRQGSLTGPVLGAPAAAAAVAATANQCGANSALDGTTEYPNGQTYVVTVQQGAATGNGTMQYVTFESEPISQIPG